MVVVLFFFLCIIFAFVLRIAYIRKDWRNVLGLKMLHLIRSFIRACDFLRTEQEQIEAKYCLFSEVQCRLLNEDKYEVSDLEHICNFIELRLFSSEELNTYSIKRFPIYLSHYKSNGSSNDNRAFVLAYFLNHARRKTIRKDLTNLLMGKRKITPNDIPELPNDTDLLSSNQILTGVNIKISEVLNDFKK